MYKYIILLLTGLSISFFNHAQTYPDGTIDSQFRLAVNMYNTGDYSQALAIFDKIINDNDYNSKTTAAEFFKAKIFFEEGKFESAKKVLSGFVEKYPRSRYLDEIKILLVKYNLEVANYYNAFRESASLIDLTSSDQYKNDGRSLAQAIALNYLNEDQLQRIHDSFTNNEIKKYMIKEYQCFHCRG